MWERVAKTYAGSVRDEEKQKAMRWSGNNSSSLVLPTTRRATQKLRAIANSPKAAAAAKMKAMLSLCIAFTLLLISARAASAVVSQLALHQRSSSIFPAASSPAPCRRSGYSILINTWKRNELLEKSLLHYSKCAGVDSIHIVWSEPDPPSDSQFDVLRRAVHLNSDKPNIIDLKFDLNREDSLNNRFKDIMDLKSDAIFSIDDDVIFPCKSVEFAFTVWKSAPATMVGFVPRMHLLENPNTSVHYIYGGWWSVWWTGTYSMILSKAAFFHKKYLHLYTNTMPQSIRDYVTKNRNCEDIAMAFLIANETGSPPIWVKARIFEMGSAGISSLGSHRDQRTQCLEAFAAVYGHMPLVATNVKAIDSRTSWLW